MKIALPVSSLSVCFLTRAKARDARRGQARVLCHRIAQ